MNQSFLHTVVLLDAFEPRGPASPVYFFLGLVACAVTALVNLVLVAVICVDPALHKPMYVFLANLAVNGVVGSTAVCPALMSNLLLDSDSRPSISYGGCLLQVLFINVYAVCTYAILAAMAYDRYVSICRPLHYHAVMTPGRVRLLLAAVNVVPVALVALQVYVTSQLPLCRFRIDKVFCDNLSLVKLACRRSAAAELIGVFIIVALIALPFCLVAASYACILRVSLRASAESRQKAWGTCAPHLVVFVNFTLCVLFSLVYNRYDSMPRYVMFFQTAQFVVVPPLLHPVVYGLRSGEIRRSAGRVLRKWIDLPWRRRTQRDFVGDKKCQVDVVVVG